MSIADDVAAQSTRLNHLELKSEADENLIALLKKQNNDQATELHMLRQERDMAVRKATEVSGIIDTLGSLCLQGLRKMKGDETPEVIEDRRTVPVLTVKHLETIDRRLPPVKPEHEPLLPRPTFMDRPRDAERQYPMRTLR